MDDAVLAIHKAVRKQRGDRPTSQLDRALEGQRDVIKKLDELIGELEKEKEGG